MDVGRVVGVIGGHERPRVSADSTAIVLRCSARCDRPGGDVKQERLVGAILDRFGALPYARSIRALSHSLRKRLFAAVLLLPLIAVATATSGFGLRCRITGEMSSACCCDDAAAKVTPVATVSEADCCDRVVRDVTIMPAVLSTTDLLLDQTTPVAYLVVRVAAVDVPQPIVAPRSEARSRLGPPTVRLRLVSKSSFLI